MAKSGKKDSQNGKKDYLKLKSGSSPVGKAKDKHKKSNPKKVLEKLGKDITTANAEFTELQSKMISEKENEKTKCDKNKQAKTSEVSSEPPKSQEKQVEETAKGLANL